MSKAVSRTEYGLAGYYWQREENRKTGQQTRGQESGCQRPQAATDATNRNCFCLSGQFSPLRLCLRSEKPYPARDTAPLGKRILLTSWRTGKQSSPPGAASRILNLSRGSLSFVETANPAISAPSASLFNFHSGALRHRRKLQGNEFCSGKYDSRHKSRSVPAVYEAILSVFQTVEIGRL